MYQSIDDIEEDGIETPQPARRERVFTVPFILITLLAAAALYFATQATHIETPPPDDISKAEQTTYRAAISEPSAALRRARLTDFLSTYPDSTRTDSVKAMLDVLKVAEANDWAALSEQIFNPKLTREEKLAALDVYEVDWGASLLGGRDTEIAALREELSAETKKFPSRKMTEEKSSIPDDVEDSVMVGGPVPIILDPIPGINDMDDDDPDKIINTAKNNKIIPPKLRKPSNPLYPRKAYRKGISALVTVSLDIDSRGRVKEVEVLSVEARDYQKDFAKASRRAAKKSRYSPKTVNGTRVATKGHVKRYRFTPE